MDERDRKLWAALAECFDELSHVTGKVARVLHGVASFSEAKPRVGALLLDDFTPTRLPPTRDDDELTRTERKLLTALVQLGRAAELPMVGIVSKLSHTAGHVQKALAELRRCGYVEGPGSALAITLAGRDAVGEVATLPQGPELFAWWCEHLGSTCGKLLRALRTPTGTRRLTLEQLGEASHLSHTAGHVQKAFATLRRMRFIVGKGTSGLELAPELVRALEPTIGVFDRQSGETRRVDRRGQVVHAP